MHLVDVERSSRGMAHITALSQRIAIRQEVSRRRLRNVTSTASGCNRADRIDPALRIGHLIQANRQILLTAINVAYWAVFQVGGLSRRAHGRVEHAGEVMVSTAETRDGEG